VIVKLKADGSYVWEKIVTAAGATNAKPQVMVTVFYLPVYFRTYNILKICF
jgi:hypothetical protein